MSAFFLGVVVLQLKADDLLVVRDLGVGGLALIDQRETIFGVDGFGATAGEHLEHQHDHDHEHGTPQPRGLPYRAVLVVVAFAIVPVIATVERVGERVAVVTVVVRVRIIAVTRPLRKLMLALLGRRTA